MASRRDNGCILSLRETGWPLSHVGGGEASAAHAPTFSRRYFAPHGQMLPPDRALGARLRPTRNGRAGSTRYTAKRSGRSKRSRPFWSVATLLTRALLDYGEDSHISVLEC